MDELFRRSALDYHRYPTPGKIALTATKSLVTQRDLALAYSPGVAAACEEIVRDPQEARSLTARGNLVAVITNGTAVLGLGAIGPLAAKPVMEGKGVLFKKFANIDVFDIEVNERDPERLVEVIAALEPTFGGINLEDIKAPECFYVERKLRERMKIPVFHDDQHGTAIIVGAAVLNGLRVVGKKPEEVKLVCSGAGAAALACLDLLVGVGLKRENIWVSDIKGVVYEGRTEEMDENKIRYAKRTSARTLDEEAVRRLDVLEVDAAEGRLERGDDVDQLLRVALVDLDVEAVDTGELLEQHALAFHHRLRGERADRAQAEYRGAVGDHRDEVRARGVQCRARRIAHDLLARRGDTGRIGEREIALIGELLGREDRDLARRVAPVVIEGALL